MALAFDKQRELIETRAPFKVVRCTRRAAKSYSAGIAHFRVGLKNPNSASIYIALTREEARRIFWEPIVKDIDRRLGLGCEFNESRLSVRIPQTNSFIYLLGMDANEKEKRKALGQKFTLATIDESQDFVVDLKPIVMDVLKPALADYRGELWMLGTAGFRTSGLYYDAQSHDGQPPVVPGWRFYSWSYEDNPHVAETIRQEVAQLKELQPGIELTPGFRRNYLNVWVMDDEGRIYHYAEQINGWDGKLPDFGPEGRGRGAWHKALGIDLGYNDAVAIVEMMYHDHDPRLFFCSAQKKEKLDFTDTAQWINLYQNVETYIIDGSNKQGVEEMRKRHNLPLIAADKRDKFDFIRLFNDDLVKGRIKVYQAQCLPLIKEWADLVRDPRSKIKPKEHPSCPNHCADGALYGWRGCTPYLFTQKVQEPALGTREYFDAQAVRLEAAALKRYTKPKELEPLEDDSNYEWWAKWN